MISIGQEYKERCEDAERKLAALREENSDSLAVNRTLNAQMYALQEQILAFEEEVDISDKEIEGLQSALEESEQRLADAERLLQRVLDSSVLSFEQDAPEELESLEADICAALNPNPEAASHDE
jgi:chromosome segregation ATPase